ncbi:protein-disulfide isomerase [Sphingomonas jejuensis]|uniref:Protein-disulfide isomerase n=1 Tax=Sphingomonas jejuensis TaxID=904715 RepID=A0ABX0XLA4_9SPHN|nr:thioredoxin domain-containing protein [Sphingomonas jejuensis]NJC33938.1 protein-disulfide isomerase [Sphingomonas jejuensis]
MSGRLLTLAAFAGVAVGAGALGAAAVMVARPAGGGVDAAAVRQALIDNPEIIPEALAKLQQRQVAGAIDAARTELETPFAGAWIGAREPAVTLVQFYDYACAYCRASLPVVQRLVREDPTLRVVFREFPVLGEASVEAARASIAAAGAGKFPAFHDALYAAGRPSGATIDATAARIGTPAGDGRADAEIAKNYRLAQSLGINSTPTWVVGDQLLAGAVGYEALKSAIEDAKAAGRT